MRRRCSGDVVGTLELSPNTLTLDPTDFVVTEATVLDGPGYGEFTGVPEYPFTFVQSAITSNSATVVAGVVTSIDFLAAGFFPRSDNGFDSLSLSFFNFRAPQIAGVLQGELFTAEGEAVGDLIDQFTASITIRPHPAPAPAVLSLLGLGLLGMISARRHRWSRSHA
jgi:hypothetical protein